MLNQQKCPPKATFIFFIYLEPLFGTLYFGKAGQNPPKQGPNSKQTKGDSGSRYCNYMHILHNVVFNVVGEI